MYNQYGSNTFKFMLIPIEQGNDRKKFRGISIKQMTIITSMLFAVVLIFTPYSLESLSRLSVHFAYSLIIILTNVSISLKNKNMMLMAYYANLFTLVLFTITAVFGFLWDNYNYYTSGNFMVIFHTLAIHILSIFLLFVQSISLANFKYVYKKAAEPSRISNPENTL